jgi:hypothetical protein
LLLDIIREKVEIDYQGQEHGTGTRTAPAS